MGKNKENELIHPAFPQPEVRSTRVWRYMDLPKLISILDKRQLFLSRLDKLNDPHEGSVPRMISSEDLKLYWKELWKELDLPQDFIEDLAKTILEIRQCMPAATYVSCWHLSDNESEAMWRLYCGADQGVAIQTTYEKLANSVIADPTIAIGLVKYIDYDKEWFPPDNLMYQCMHKRIAFAHEKEVRIIKTLLRDYRRGLRKDGIYVDWNPEKVIEHIYINPYAPRWYYDIVKATVRKFAFVLKSRVKWSTMKSLPFY